MKIDSFDMMESRWLKAVMSKVSIVKNAVAIS